MQRGDFFSVLDQATHSWLVSDLGLADRKLIGNRVFF
jgi:hypothetical protein